METTLSQPAKKSIIRLIYLYLVALIGLVVFLIGGVGMVNTGLKVVLGVDGEYYYTSVKDVCRGQFGERYVGGPKSVPTPVVGGVAIVPVDANSAEFKQCLVDEEERQKKQQSNDRRRNIAEALAMMILGAPIWLYHWHVIQRDNSENKQSVS